MGNNPNLHWKTVLSTVIQRKMEAQKQFIVFIIEPKSKWIYNKRVFGGGYIRVNRDKKTMKCSIKRRTNVRRKANTRL